MEEDDFYSSLTGLTQNSKDSYEIETFDSCSDSDNSPVELMRKANELVESSANFFSDFDNHVTSIVDDSFSSIDAETSSIISNKSTSSGSSLSVPSPIFGSPARPQVIYFAYENYKCLKFSCKVLKFSRKKSSKLRFPILSARWL